MKRFFPMWARITLLVFAVLTIGLRLWIVQTTYKISQMDKEITNEAREVERRSIAVSRLKTPERLKRLASERYHLQSPRSDQVIRLEVKP